MIDPRPAFIPHRAEPASRPLMTIGANWFFTAGVIALILGALITAGMFGYKMYLGGVRNGEVETVQTRENELRTNGSLEEITAFSQSLAAAQSLLQNHIVPTSLIALLAENTHTRVQIKSFAFNGLARRADLSGLASSYRTVAEQVTVYEAHPDVESVKFGGLSLDTRGLVTFSMALILKPSAFDYPQP